jgi:hypothetical protein
MVEISTANQEALGYFQEHWESMTADVPDGMCCAFSPDFKHLVAYGVDWNDASARATEMGEVNPRLFWKPHMNLIIE